MIVLCKQLQVIVTTDVVPGIVPEFDIPGHSKGFEPLAWGPNPDIMFCSELPDVNQLYDDPAVRYVPSAPVLFASRIGNFARSHSNILVVLGVTYKTLHALMGEMATLFTDEVFNIGRCG